jgi:urease accessory protein
VHNVLVLVYQVRQGGSAHGHQAALFGWVCRSLGVGLETTERMFMYLMLRDMMAAATRLGILGPMHAVRIQMSLYGCVEGLLRGRGLGTSPVTGAVAQNNPLLDILQGTHEKLYSRLFNS